MYEILFRALGPQHWWPGEGAAEISIGAVLTQNTAWSNVERAIVNLRKEGALGMEALARMPLRRLERLVRPSGYFRQKTRRLKGFAAHALRRGGLAAWYRRPAAALREELLSLHGIGPETADSILLYAASKKSFVVDAYTRRVLLRHGFSHGRLPYGALKAFLEESLPRSLRLYNEFHALFVNAGKRWCRRRNPLCASCPLRDFRPVHPGLLP
jgi:endonuclease-3 related protein